MTGYEALGLWIGLHVLLLLLLKGNVGRARQASEVSFGDGGNEPLIRAIRVQGNAVEDVPISLLGLGAVALMGAPALLIHGLGAVLLVSRLLHAFGLGATSGRSFGRFAGTVGSMLCQLAIVIACFWFALT